MSENGVPPISTQISDLENKLFDNVHLAIAVVDQERTILRVNQTFCLMFGYNTPAEVVGLSATKFHLSKDKFTEFGKQAVEKVLKADAVSVPYQLKKKDGTVFWVQISGQPINNGQGVLWMLADITERRELMLRLQRDEARYRLLSEYATDVVWVLDLPALTFSYFSPSVLGVRGYSPEEAVELSLEQTLTPESCARARNILLASLAKDQDHDDDFERVRFIELQEYCKDGSVIDTEARVRYIRDDDNKPIQVIGSSRNITERKQAESRLKESEQKFRVAFNTIPEPVAINRVEDGVYIDVNERFEQLSGYLRGELIGQSSLDVNIWRDPEDRRRMVEGLREQGKVENLEAQFVSKDGHVIYGLMSARVVEIDGEKYILNITRDITARKFAEEKYTKLIKEANIGIGLADADTGELLECNQALASMVGRSCDELIGQSQSVLHPPEACDETFAAGFTEIREAGGKKLLEQRCITKDGEIFDVEIKGTRLVLGEREVQLGFFQDISERKQQHALLQARLRLSEAAASLSQKELLQKFVDEAELLTSSKIGFLHFVNTDQDHLFLQVWSSSTLENFCQSTNEENHYPVSKAGVWADCVRKKVPVIHNDYMSLPHKKGLPDGHAEVVRELVVPLFSAHRIFAILGVGNKQSNYSQRDVRALTEFGHLAWDIIARKGSEEQRSELELQLRQKYKMEAVGVMAGGIAHNFNNNLAIILGNLEMAVRKQGNAESLAKYLNNAKTAVLRSRDLVSQILTYSHQDRKELGVVDICIVINETLRLLKSTLPASIQLSYQCTVRSMSVKADPGQIQEALINLCNNAVYAMNERGTLQISLKLTELQDQDIPARCSGSAGAYALLVVEDNGCGIEPDIVDRIFDPFFTTKGVDRGTGMGLSTVQGIFDQHGGFINVESQVGQGTAFYLYLPVEEQKTEVASDLPIESATQGGAEKILLVDDDLTLLALVGQMLGEIGYQVTTAAGSGDALSIFSKSPAAFDLLITDQTMPGLTGKDLIKEVRALRGDIPVILITGYSSQINMAESQDLGINAFCMKPLGMSELGLLVRQVLDGGSQ